MAKATSGWIKENSLLNRRLIMIIFPVGQNPRLPPVALKIDRGDVGAIESADHLVFLAMCPGIIYHNGKKTIP
jgi:hypothetical protein